MGKVPDTAMKVIFIIAACVQIIAGASCFYTYDKMGYGSAELATGFSPSGSSKGKYGLSWFGPFVNHGYFTSFSLLMFGIISLFMAVVEIGLFFFPKYFEFASAMILRAVIYVIVGIAVLGTANDLGIAAGSMDIIVGAVMIIIYIVDNVKC